MLGPYNEGYVAGRARRLTHGGHPGARAVAASRYVESIRRFGHRAARLDPLGAEPPGDPLLDPAAHGLDDAALGALPAALVTGSVGRTSAHLRAAVQVLRSVYCGRTGYDYDHVHEPLRRSWLREAAEARMFRQSIDDRAILARLTRVEAFERFLHRVFPGRTRFSIEGLDILVPMLDDLVGQAAEAGVRRVLLCASHRGRLNILAHVLGMGYGEILAQFGGEARARAFRDDLAWSGDVTYHEGARHAVRGGRALPMVVELPPNPSHVQLALPVVQGMARAAGTRAELPGAPRFDASRTIPVMIHGDAAFPGQGVTAETLNLANLAGYATGGSIHIVANNRLGYTTLPAEGRSTLYASDLAKGVQVPVVHVNADDPEACIEAVRTAFAYRARFGDDFLVDLVGYRRHGHNEGDEPSFTQPVLYAAVREHPTVRTLWARALARRGVVGEDEAKDMMRRAYGRLRRARERAAPARDEGEGVRGEGEGTEGATTAVEVAELRRHWDALRRLPGGFTLHRKIARTWEERRHALDDPEDATVDWAAAEELAFATLLADGVPVRLTGEDAERGTFSQRHAVLHDARTGERHVPLQATGTARAAFEVRNSPLTENAVLGFEYGYSVAAPDRLVLWDAQYGDFANGAQAVIDEFVVAGRAKWRQRSSLVLLLPHGYEGQGPDHSSARPERWLGLAAGGNLRVANCTTAAQLFHLLRDQGLRRPCPLVLLTPKSLLRHPGVASPPGDLARGVFRPVLAGAGRDVARVLVCSGKVALDLERDLPRDAVVVRLERLHPRPRDELAEVLEAHGDAEEVVWVQEEPANMGAWPHVKDMLRDFAPGRLRYVGRRCAASPAEGAAAWHDANRDSILQMALDPAAEPGAGGFVVSRRA